jgi:hypothetical protein
MSSLARPSAIAAWLLLGALACRSIATEPADAVDRALAFLRVEVPKWKTDNACFSCHNNGDAARALIAAARLGKLADRRPLADTLAFLAQPAAWDDNGPDGPFKDKQLARVQFAMALAEAARAGLIEDRKALDRAAALLVELQAADGSWQIGPADQVGSPVTYGRALATLVALRALETLGPQTHREAIAGADRWFESTEPKSVLDAAATLWALARATSKPALAQRQRALALIRRGQSDDGGWGPFANAPPEVFDTAIVLLALAAQTDKQELEPLVARGRRYLLKEQLADGSWPETTRPHGAESYAQRLSTTGWAVQALLAK